ncbi:MAG: rare lipoprotein A [Ignavibacteria bacterium]|nr:MAG: rare lipoprotein A [Ignavibacteria bacterium]KAF0158898.1 MAG: rare lipoprotein A [Ignavibacteria bacterium]
MRYIKTLSIISLVVVSAGLINLGDTPANINHGLTKVNVSKDAEPNLAPVELSDIGVMTASWYGPRFHGKTTANGEIYNQMALTAAHKSLPFGTLLQITNPRNGKSVIVRINDRGPYIEGRELDLSKGTAKTLGIIQKGVVRVKVQQVVINSENIPVGTLN